MTEYTLKYGCNPNQNPARIHMDGKDLPFEILNGSAGYINLLDAFNSCKRTQRRNRASKRRFFQACFSCRRSSCKTTF